MAIRTLALAALLGAAAAATSARAEDLNLKEKPDTVQASIAPYSLGLGAGVLSSINNELSDRSAAFLKLSVIQSIQFTDHVAAGLDLDWLLPGQNWGGDLTLDYLMLTGAIKPFVGIGGGIRYFDKAGPFGDNIGASGTVHAGLILDVMDEMQLRIRVPYHVVANKAMDQGVGIDVGFLFSSPLRTTKVKKLKY
ncbi:MAG: hypothetical protein JF616_09555 [Fibrobacteres bacterium]|nr:hypothetical protein [Fibrobacterota bacterium]